MADHFCLSLYSIPDLSNDSEHQTNHIKIHPLDLYLLNIETKQQIQSDFKRSYKEMLIVCSCIKLLNSILHHIPVKSVVVDNMNRYSEYDLSMTYGLML